MLFSIVVMAASAQKLKGNIDFLKGQEEVNVIFDFDGVTMDGDTEQEYIEDRIEDQSKEDADKWLAEWNGSARKSFKKTYVKYFNDESKKFEIGNFPEAEYTIIVKINDIDPGNFAGPFSNPAKIKTTVNIIKTGEEGTILASISNNKDYNNFTISPVEFNRIESGFGEAGKMLAKFMNKKVK